MVDFSKLEEEKEEASAQWCVFMKIRTV